MLRTAPIPYARSLVLLTQLAADIKGVTEEIATEGSVPAETVQARLVRLEYLQQMQIALTYQLQRAQIESGLTRRQQRRAALKDLVASYQKVIAMAQDKYRPGPLLSEEDVRAARTAKIAYEDEIDRLGAEITRDELDIHLVVATVNDCGPLWLAYGVTSDIVGLGTPKG